MMINTFIESFMKGEIQVRYNTVCSPTFYYIFRWEDGRIVYDTYTINNILPIKVGTPSDDSIRDLYRSVITEWIDCLIIPTHNNHSKRCVK